MILWKKDNIDIVKRHEEISQAYQIKNPEKIQGYDGYFNFCFGEIWIDETIKGIIEKNIIFKNVLDDLLNRFLFDDYGDVTVNEKDANMENRYFWGQFVGLHGKYRTEYGLINIVIIAKGVTHITII